MALVTVQRSPSPSNTPDTFSSDLGDGVDGDDSEQRSPLRSCNFSESYLAVKGAALILPQSECPRAITRSSHGGDIQTHLQSMFYLLRPQDTIKVAVKVESVQGTTHRYMVVVSTIGRQDTEESIILGVDIVEEKATIGLVLPIWGDLNIRLDGDGGFSVTCKNWFHIFKPVSVQAMWSALQSLIKVRDVSNLQSYYPGGLTHTWISYYEVRINSPQQCVYEWNVMEDVESHRKEIPLDESSERVKVEKQISAKLKEIMYSVDLEEVTSRYLRTSLEEVMGTNLKEYRQFIDEEMLTVLGQMDAASEIFSYLYLGSEWNASNLEELKANGIGYILNITREIDNFFLGMFKYCNIRLYDVEQSELLKHWDDTYRFISHARKNNSKVLVHCKMGVSRSASTVIAYAMKEYGWSLKQAHDFVQGRRSVVRPNSGFMAQLETYEGILDASKQRHNLLFRSASVGNLRQQHLPQEATVEGRREHSVEIDIIRRFHDDSEIGMRPRSWSPEDGMPQILLKAQDLGSDDESTDDDHNAAAAYADYQFAMETEEFEDLTSIPFTLDNCDEYDISSRSADSLDVDEGHPDAGSMDPDSQYDFSGSNILLLSHKTHPDAVPQRDEPRTDPSEGEESDMEDFVQRDIPAKREWGYYDISMLTELQEELEENEGAASDGTDLPDLLHPDEMLESILSQQKKQLRIAQLLKLSQAKKKKVPTATLR